MSKRLTDEELRAIRERAEKATLAPWQLADTADGAWLLDDADMIIAGTFERDEDAVFSAYARQDIPKLLAEIERLQRRNKLANDLLMEVEEELVDFYLAETDIYTEIQEFLYGSDSDD